MRYLHFTSDGLNPVSTRKVTVKVVNGLNPLEAFVVELPCPISQFWIEQLLYFAKEHLSPKISQIVTLTGQKVAAALRSRENGTPDYFQPFPNGTVFIAQPYEFLSPQYAAYGLEQFFADISQSSTFSAAYHLADHVFVPKDYKNELLHGHNIKYYFQRDVNGAFRKLDIDSIVKMGDSFYVIVDIFQDSNRKKIFVLEPYRKSP